MICRVITLTSVLFTQVNLQCHIFALLLNIWNTILVFKRKAMMQEWQKEGSPARVHLTHHWSISAVLSRTSLPWYVFSPSEPCLPLPSLYPVCKGLGIKWFVANCSTSYLAPRPTTSSSKYSEVRKGNIIPRLCNQRWSMNSSWTHKMYLWRGPESLSCGMKTENRTKLTPEHVVSMCLLEHVFCCHSKRQTFSAELQFFPVICFLAFVSLQVACEKLINSVDPIKGLAEASGMSTVNAYTWFFTILSELRLCMTFQVCSQPCVFRVVLWRQTVSWFVVGVRTMRGSHGVWNWTWKLRMGLSGTVLEKTASFWSIAQNVKQIPGTWNWLSQCDPPIRDTLDYIGQRNPEPVSFSPCLDLPCHSKKFFSRFRPMISSNWLHGLPLSLPV